MIHRIRIQNFKSLRDVTVELSPVTVFIGKSGTGKSNFVSGLRFLRDCLASGRPDSSPQHVSSYRCATNPSGRIRFEIEFGVPGFPEAFLYQIEFPEETPQGFPRAESLGYGTRCIFRQVQAGAYPGSGLRWEVEPSMVSPPPPGPVALGRLPGVEEAVVAFTALTASIGVYFFPFEVLTKPQSANRTFGLMDRGENALDMLRDITSNLQNVAIRKGIAAALRSINPTVAGVELDSLQNPQTAFVSHRLGEKTLLIELGRESDGFRRFYAHLLALYQTPPKQTLVFEEPENGIYPGALSLLGEEFKAAPDSGRGQVLLTTHSPALLDEFTADQIRVVELVDLETRIGPLAEEQKEAIREDLLHSGELLTVDFARGNGG